MKKTHKVIAGFAARAIIIYLLLIAPWPGLRKAHGGFTRVFGSAFFGSFGNDGIVRFLPDENEEYSSMIALTNRDLVRTAQRTDGNLQFLKVPLNTWVLGYQPISLLVALILASPISSSRRGWALLWGLLLEHGYIAFQLLVMIVYSFNRSNLSVIELQPFWSGTFTLLYSIVVTGHALRLTVPVFIWIAVCFRRNDWEIIGKEI